MKLEPLKYSYNMRLMSNSNATTMEHLNCKRPLSDRLAEEKSCNKNNNNNANKRMKHHQERQFGNSRTANPMTSSSSSDGNESDDNSSPFNLAKPVNRNTKATYSSSNQNEKQTLEIPADKLETLNQYKKSLPLHQSEDSSSTSNCSCEQHGDDHGNDGEFDEKLDYDEDSITNSPLDSTPSNSNNNKSLPISSSERSSSATALVAEDIVSGSDTQNAKQETQQQQTTPKPKPISSSSCNLRLKSVINTNHRPNDKLEDSVGASSESSSPRSYHKMLKCLFKDACFFQMKSINHENIKISKSMSIWSTPIPNEVRLNQAFKEHRNVILIFSVQQSGCFQGFARMVSESKPATRALPWILPERLNCRALRGVFEVQWICKKELPFHLAHDLFNLYNDNKPVKVARDGQQVESRTGKKLCKLFPDDNKDRLSEIVALMKHQASQRKKYPNRYDNDLNPYAYRQNTDTWRRDAFSVNTFFQHQHPHPHHRHHDDEHLKRADDELNFNCRSFEPHGPSSFQNNYLNRPPPRHYHHPLYNPPPYQHPMDQYLPPQDIWRGKPIVIRHHTRDNRPRR